MNKSFLLLDKNNNLQKTADVIVKFNLEEKDYLVYAIAENEQNSQIFVSKLILNSEGKSFIDSISLDEKNKLSNIVYNIVILIPTEAKKGNSFEILSKNLFDKFSVKLSLGVSILEMQEYYSSCSIAITNNLLVTAATNFYENNLRVKQEEVVNVIPTWTAPAEVTAPVPIDVTNNTDNIVSSTPIQSSEIVVSNNLLSSGNGPVMPGNDTLSISTNEVNPSFASLPNVVELREDVVVSNPQIEKIAIVSDPSLGFGVEQSNLIENKKAGFANTKYIVIGTACLILAVAVIIVAYFLISNMQ